MNYVENLIEIFFFCFHINGRVCMFGEWVLYKINKKKTGWFSNHAIISPLFKQKKNEIGIVINDEKPLRLRVM